jgi:hypothetical protein
MVNEITAEVGIVMTTVAGASSLVMEMSLVALSVIAKPSVGASVGPADGASLGAKVGVADQQALDVCVTRKCRTSGNAGSSGGLNGGRIRRCSGRGSGKTSRCLGGSCNCGLERRRRAWCDCARRRHRNREY